jgi:hypothetical protein
MLNRACKVMDAFDDVEFCARTALVGLKRTESQKAGIVGTTDERVLFLIHFLLAAVVLEPLPLAYLTPYLILPQRSTFLQA